MKTVMKRGTKDSLAYLKFLLGNSYVEVPCGQHPEQEEAQGLICICWIPGSGGTRINKPQDLPSSNSQSSRGDWHTQKISSKIINWNLYKHSSSKEEGGSEWLESSTTVKLESLPHLIDFRCKFLSEQMDSWTFLWCELVCFRAYMVSL